jgi:hypothetical protein
MIVSSFIGIKNNIIAVYLGIHDPMLHGYAQQREPPNIGRFLLCLILATNWKALNTWYLLLHIML